MHSIDVGTHARMPCHAQHACKQSAHACMPSLHMSNDIAHSARACKHLLRTRTWRMDTWPSEHVWHSTRVQKLDAHACVCARSSCHRCMKHASAIIFANLTLISVHHPSPPHRILAGEHPAGTRGGRRRAVSGDAREGTPS